MDTTADKKRKSVFISILGKIFNSRMNNIINDQKDKEMQDPISFVEKWGLGLISLDYYFSYPDGTTGPNIVLNANGANMITTSSTLNRPVGVGIRLVD